MRQPSWLLGLSLLGFLAAPLSSADSQTTVGIALFPPNALPREGGNASYTGFDMELWREISRHTGIDSEFKLQSFEELLKAVTGSTSADLVHSYGARPVEVGEFADVYRLLEERDVNAVVFDAPPLFQYLKEKSERHVAVVGLLLNSESYGVAFPNGSPLREKVNRAILKLQGDEPYRGLHEKWFGEAP